MDAEREQLERCRAGDEAAWADLYYANAPTVARFLQRMLGPCDDLDDLIQQVFVELFSSLDRFRGDAKLSTWLYRISAHVVSKRLRSARRHRRRLEAFARDGLHAIDPAQNTPRRRVEARSQLRIVAAVVDCMDTRHRTVWVMRELEGLSTEDVAEALELRAGTVRSRLFKARKAVVAALEAAEAEQAGRQRSAG